MKNLMSISLVLTVLLIPSLLVGQSNTKGTFFIGAELASDANDRILDLNMTPRFGYFVSDKFVLGASMDRQVLSLRRLRLSDVGLFARYYLPVDFSEKKNLFRRLTFFGEATMKAPISTFGDNISAINLGIDTYIGANVQLNDRLFLEVSLSPDWSDGLSLDLEPRVGFEYRLASKK